MAEKKKEEGIETEICDGRLSGVFKGFRNYDTIFKFQGGSSWRQDEYFYQYHFRDSPQAKITKITRSKDHKEFFYIEIDGVEAPVQVKAAYV